LIPERDENSASFQGGKFIPREHNDRFYQVYSSREKEKTRILRDMVDRTWGKEDPDEPDPYFNGTYSNDWDDLFEAPADKTASIPISRVNLVDRLMRRWLHELTGRKKYPDQARGRDYENENDIWAFEPANHGTDDQPSDDEAAIEQEFMGTSDPLARLVGSEFRIDPKSRKAQKKSALEWRSRYKPKNLVIDTGSILARPSLFGAPDFQDLVRMKRIPNAEKRRSAVVRPWNGVWGLDFDPKKVPRYVGWSLFASARYQMEYHPEYLPWRSDNAFSCEFVDPADAERAKREREDESKVFDKDEAATLDFFRVLHIKTGNSTKIVAQGRVDTFSELIVAGNGKGMGAFGYGRGRTADEAMENAYKDVYKNLLYIPLTADRNLWSSEISAKDHRAYVEIKSTIGARDNKGSVLFTMILDLLGIQGASIKKWGSRNIKSQIRALFRALASTGDAKTWATMSRVPVLPPRFFSGAAYVEPRNLRKVHDDYELVEGGFGYHQEARLIQNNMKRLDLMKKEKKQYLETLSTNEAVRKKYNILVK
jgi:ribosomal protein S5